METGSRLISNDDRNVGQEILALTQVLEAEKAAQTQLDIARTQAETLIQEARETARETAARTDMRIQALHSHFRENIALKKAESEKKFQHEKGSRRARIGTDEVIEITSRLARRIVGVTRE